MTTTLVEALRSQAQQHSRAASRLAAELAQKKATGGDIRSASVKVVELLAAGHELAATADGLESGTLAVITPGATNPPDPDPEPASGTGPTPVAEPDREDDDDDDGPITDADVVRLFGGE